MLRVLLFGLMLCDLASSCGRLRAADPAPSLNDLIAKLDAAKKTAADQTKAVADIEKQIRDQFAAIRKLLADRGLADAEPPEVAPKPKVVDPLIQKLRDAYAADKGTRAQLDELVAVYSAATGYARKAASTKDLQDNVRDVATEFLKDFGPDTLRALRSVVAAEMIAKIGQPSTDPIGADQRKAAVTLFANLVAILDGF